MRIVNSIALLLIIVGALNWGLVGAFNFNLVDALLGWAPALETIVYILVGLSALFVLINDSKHVFAPKSEATTHTY